MGQRREDTQLSTNVHLGDDAQVQFGWLFGDTENRSVLNVRIGEDLYNAVILYIDVDSLRAETVARLAEQLIAVGEVLKLRMIDRALAEHQKNQLSLI